jgi:hypothetical protein
MKILLLGILSIVLLGVAITSWEAVDHYQGSVVLLERIHPSAVADELSREHDWRLWMICSYCLFVLVSSVTIRSYFVSRSGDRTRRGAFIIYIFGILIAAVAVLWRIST